MSDQDTPPPSDDNQPGEDAPPPADPAPPAQDSAPAEAAPAQDSPPPAEAAPASEAPPSGGVALGQGSLAENDEKTMGMLAHILGAVTCILGPLIIWLIKREESPFVNDQGKEALNFQITVLIGYVAAGIVAVIPAVGCVSALLYPAIGIASLVLGILGGLEANKGKAYRYPFALRLIS